MAMLTDQTAINQLPRVFDQPVIDATYDINVLDKSATPVINQSNDIAF